MEDDGTWMERAKKEKGEVEAARSRPRPCPFLFLMRAVRRRRTPPKLPDCVASVDRIYPSTRLSGVVGKTRPAVEAPHAPERK